MNTIASICCITFNHAQFIRDALDGFLMQRTDFPIEILIHDDASTDGTSDIIREYEKRYPNVIKPIYQTENQYSKRIRIGATYVWPKTRGKYIALCEGDDYWTDPLKLQKQVDFLENHPDYSACFHPAVCLDQIDGATSGYIIRPRIIQPFYSTDDLLRYGSFAHTASLVFRKSFLPQRPEWLNQTPTGDFPLQVLLSLKGPFGFIDETMSVYRLHVGGIWSGADSTFQIEASLGNILLIGKNLGLMERESWKSCISRLYVKKYKTHLSRGQLASAFMSACRSLLLAPKGTILSILSQAMYLKEIAQLIQRSARTIRYKGIRVFIQNALSRFKGRVSVR